MTVKPNSKNPISIDNLSYEDAYSELERIVASLESGEKTLEEALSLFDHGKKLADHCARLLDNAEMQVKILTSNDFEGISSNQE